MIPQRMNTVAVVLSRIDKVSTPVDADFGSPEKGRDFARYTDVSVAAQVVYRKNSEEQNSLSGDPGASDGHLTFSRVYLDGISLMPSKGDLIKSIAGFPTNFRVTEVRPSGHLRGVYNLVMAYFEQNPNTNPSIRR